MEDCYNCHIIERAFSNLLNVKQIKEITFLSTSNIICMLDQSDQMSFTKVLNFSTIYYPLLFYMKIGEKPKIPMNIRDKFQKLLLVYIVHAHHKEFVSHQTCVKSSYFLT